MKTNAELRDRLQELGLHADVEQTGTAHSTATRLHLSRGQSAETFTLVRGQSLRLTNLKHEDLRSGLRLFIDTDFVGVRTADGFRRANIQYLDEVGNALIEFGDVLIDIRGRASQADPARPRAAGDLFSAGRSQVIFALLAWPELWERPQRALARCSGVSLGQVNQTLSLLENAGYRPWRDLNNTGELLDLWSAAFRTGLARRLELARFQGEVGAPVRPHGDELVSISGETAVPALLRPGSATVYVSDLDPMFPIVNRWRADGSPNITVRERFWSTPHEEPANVSIAPWPLIYADLLASDDPRVRGAAHQVRAAHDAR